MTVFRDTICYIIIFVILVSPSFNGRIQNQDSYNKEILDKPE